MADNTVTDALIRSSIGIGILAPDGRWTFVNDRLAGALGVSPAALVGEHWEARTHPEDIAESRAEFERVRRGEFLSAQFEMRALVKDGVAELQRKSDEVVHALAAEQANSAKSRIQRSQNQLLTLINDILKFAKLQSGTLEFVTTEFSVDDGLRHADDLIRPQMDKKRIDYKYETGDPAPVSAFPRKNWSGFSIRSCR